MAFDRSRFSGSAYGQPCRTNFHRDGERFPLSSEERAGVRSGVQLICPVHFSFFRQAICFKIPAWGWR
jgi:hypothetical protein